MKKKKKRNNVKMKPLNLHNLNCLQTLLPFPNPQRRLNGSPTPYRSKSCRIALLDQGMYLVKGFV